MTISTSKILDILRAHGIEPEERLEGFDLPDTTARNFPEIGEIKEGETVYTTSITGEIIGSGGLNAILRKNHAAPPMRGCRQISGKAEESKRRPGGYRPRSRPPR